MISPASAWFGPRYPGRWDVLRLDRMHPHVGGNKSFKLKGFLDRARESGMRGVLTFGGPWSNHLLATAWAAREAGLASIGMVRGECKGVLPPTLADARAWGMELRFLDRAAFRELAVSDGRATALEPGYLQIPAGGGHRLGMLGAAEIHRHIPAGAYDVLTCACGTGTTLAGLIHGMASPMQVVGVSALKGFTELDQAIRSLLPPESAAASFETVHDAHFGGFAKWDRALTEFMAAFHRATGIPTDIVYTGKLMHATAGLIGSGRIAQDARVLTIHSGGLQGNRSLPQGILPYA